MLTSDQSLDYRIRSHILSESMNIELKYKEQ